MVVIHERSALLRKATIHFLEAGEDHSEGPLVVFCHGFPDTAHVWNHQMKSLGENFQVIAPFWGKVGDSSLSVERMDLEALAMDLRSLIDERDPLKKRRIYIVGHDMGGPIVREMETLLGDRLSGVVYLNSLGIEQFAYRLTSVRQVVKSLYMLAFQLPVFHPKVMAPLRSAIFKVAHAYGGLHDETGYDERETRRALEGIYFYKRFIKLVPEKVFAEPHKRTLPCLYLWGENDPFLNIPTKKEITHFYPNGEIRVLPGGHWLMKSHAEQVSSILKRTFDVWSSKKS